MRRLLREPLVHFLLGGLALFLLYGQVASEPDAGPGRIVIDEGRVANLIWTFERTWMRPPTPTELDGLVDEFVKEEILYREAMELGLDDDDLIIRRRLRQKMEFLSSDLAEGPAPSDAELQVFLDENSDRFRAPETTSFVQVFVDPARVGSEPEAAAASLLSQLRSEAASDEAARAHSHPTMLPAALEIASAREIANQFGTGFASTVVTLPVGAWEGPVPSSYGLHLVRVTARVPGRLPPLAEIRPVVEREWSSLRRAEGNEAFYRSLRDRYEVEVRMPDEAADDEVAGRAP